MSHVAAIQITINDLEALKDACKELGLDFREGQTTWKWYGRWMNDYDASDAAYKNGIRPEDYGKSLHAIRVPGAEYEIGVVRNPNGPGYTLAYDFWGDGGQPIINRLGKGLEKLKQIYGVHCATRLARSRGKTVTRTTTPKGIKLTISA